jgi:hypothetical protein
LNDPTQRPLRSQALLDAIEAESPRTFAGEVWRVVTDGFDVLRPGRSGGRWDDGSFDVLYTSSERNGALAESWFHSARGQPVVPSRVKKRLFRIEASLIRVLDLSGDGKLASLGVAMGGYGRLSYVQRSSEYPTLQQIAEAAYFYEYQAIIAPNARWPTSNVVVFTEYVKPGDLSADHGEIVDLNGWYAGEGKAGMRS